MVSFIEYHKNKKLYIFLTEKPPSICYGQKRKKQRIKRLCLILCYAFYYCCHLNLMTLGSCRALFILATSQSPSLLETLATAYNFGMYPWALLMILYLDGGREPEIVWKLREKQVARTMKMIGELEIVRKARDKLYPLSRTF